MRLFDQGGEQEKGEADGECEGEEREAGPGSEDRADGAVEDGEEPFVAVGSGHVLEEASVARDRRPR